MEHYATDLTLSFGFCFYIPLWLFFNFLISCLALLCLPVCKPKVLGSYAAHSHSQFSLTAEHLLSHSRNLSLIHSLDTFGAKAEPWSLLFELFSSHSRVVWLP